MRDGKWKSEPETNIVDKISGKKTDTGGKQWSKKSSKDVILRLKEGKGKRERERDRE